MNVVMIKGNFTTNPVTKNIGQTSITEFSIAYNFTKKDKTKIAHFFNCKSWGKSGQYIQQNFHKGSPAIVEGELASESWTDKQSGAKRSNTVINVRTASMVTYPARNENNYQQNNNQQNNGGNNQQNNNQNNNQQYNQQYNQQNQNNGGGNNGGQAQNNNQAPQNGNYQQNNGSGNGGNQGGW